MPTYDYRCKKCQHKFENYQPITSKPLRKCPECGGAVERLIGGGSGILFKGSGFYQTDYRSSKYHEAAKKEKTADPKPEAKDKGPATKESTAPKSDSGSGKKKDK